MQSLRKRFGGLYWRLTGSYFLVTLLAAFIIEVAITFSTSTQEYQRVTVSPTPSGSSPPSSPTPFGISLFLTIFWNHLQGEGLYFILIASVIGTLTGLLITRNVTRRLRRITQAAEAWSKGEFGVEVRDPTRDELGQMAQDLNRMAEQVRTLLVTRQELAIVEERNRLARELHDSVKQQVFASALLIRAGRLVLSHDPEKAQTHLLEAEGLATETQQALIELIRALRPAALADKGLGAVLQEYTTDWSRRMGISVDVRIQSERTTPVEIEEALFRVIQEALANVARHSNAEKVEVQLAWTERQVSLTIQDNGKGFGTTRVEGKGLGLANMRERVKGLDGTLTISSSPGRTRVEACIPLAQALPHTTEEVMYE
jgi:NarL family two-component system sensor histidine kinase LiaS